MHSKDSSAATPNAMTPNFALSKYWDLESILSVALFPLLCLKVLVLQDLSNDAQAQKDTTDPSNTTAIQKPLDSFCPR